MEEVIFVVWADQAGAGLAVQPPLLQVVLIAVLALPSHLDQRVAILKHPVPAGEGPLGLLLGKSDMQFMRPDILRPKVLIWPVAQQLIPDKFLDHDNLIVHSTGPALDTALFPFLIERPKRHCRDPISTKILHIILVEIASQNVKWDSIVLASGFNKFDLLRYPHRLDPQITINDCIISWHFGV